MLTTADRIFILLDKTPERYGQTDGQTDGQSVRGYYSDL